VWSLAVIVNVRDAWIGSDALQNPAAGFFNEKVRPNR
jgi:hypothetical protein